MLNQFVTVCVFFLLYAVFVISKCELILSDIIAVLSSFDKFYFKYEIIGYLVFIIKKRTKRKHFSTLNEHLHFSYLRTILEIYPGGFDEFYSLLQNHPFQRLSLYDEMCFEINRLKSFATAPHLNVSTIILARNGFYFVSKRNTCRCVFCGFEYKDWTERDDVTNIHRTLSPSCPFVNNRSHPDNVSITPHVANNVNRCVSQAVTCHGYLSNLQQINRTRKIVLNREGRNQQHDQAEELGIAIDIPKYQNYRNLRIRISSFYGWPKYLDQSPRDMALAGFFYAGSRDYCKCFNCGGGLCNWDPGDDPWIEHARWFPNCSFLRQNRGQQFIDMVTKRVAESQDLKSNEGSRTDTSCLVQNTSDGPPTLALCRPPWTVAEAYTQPQAAALDPTSNQAMVESGIRSLEEDNIQLKEQIMCKICLDKNVSIVFAPCGHLVCCIDCAPAMRKCPICRALVKNRIKIFLI